MPATQRGTSGPRVERSGGVSLPAGSVLGEMWRLSHLCSFPLKDLLALTPPEGLVRAERL